MGFLCRPIYVLLVSDMAGNQEFTPEAVKPSVPESDGELLKSLDRAWSIVIGPGHELAKQCWLNRAHPEAFRMARKKSIHE